MHHPWAYEPQSRVESYWLDEFGNPVWAYEYPVGYHEARYLGGDVSPEASYASGYVGLDYPALTSYGQQLGQKLGQWGMQAGQAIRQNIPDLGSYSQKLSTGVGQTLLGDAPQRASKAADAAAAAADAITSLSRRANESLDRADKTMKQHEETVRIVKFVVIGIGVLGGAALLFSMVKK
jgi:hypothetical protein